MIDAADLLLTEATEAEATMEGASLVVRALEARARAAPAGLVRLNVPRMRALLLDGSPAAIAEALRMIGGRT